MTTMSQSVRFATCVHVGADTSDTTNGLLSRDMQVIISCSGSCMSSKLSLRLHFCSSRAAQRQRHTISSMPTPTPMRNTSMQKLPWVCHNKKPTMQPSGHEGESTITCNHFDNQLSREPLHVACIVSGVTVTLQFPDPAVGSSKTLGRLQISYGRRQGR